MRLKQTSTNIYIRHIPVIRWAAGFVSIFIIIYLIAWLFLSETDGSSIVVDTIYIIVGAFAFLAVVYLSIFDFWSNSGILAPLTSVVLNKSEKFIDISYTRFYGKRVRRLYFNQVGKFRSYKIKRLGYPRYFLSLKLPNHKSIRMDIPLGGDKNKCVKLIKILNQVVNLKQNK